LKKKNVCETCGEKLKKKSCGLFLSKETGSTNEEIFACGNENCGMLHDTSGKLIILKGKGYTEKDLVKPPKK